MITRYGLRLFVSCLLLILAAIYPVYVDAQTPGTKGLDVTPDNTPQHTGKTYALIVGISQYQYPECYPSLHYADVDARTFYSYMVSKTGGNIDPANVDTLFNAGATQQDFWKKFNSIKNRLQKDDNFYIYFSGHGDAISSDLAFLLTYNAPPGNDRNNYYTMGGVVDIHVLKSMIKMITLDKTKPAHVILITDACRSNELPPGKEEGRQQFYDEMYTKNAGEIQLVSCLANQVSFEDAKWGGGRGLFSWHLINGMMGMADNKPEDGVVTLKELITYVTDKVQDDSYDKVTKKYKQTPDYCCRDKDDVVLATVDKPTKDALAEKLKQGALITSGLPAYASKGVNLGEEMRNEGYEDLYKKFAKAISDNRLIEPANDNAMNYLQELLSKDIKPELKSDLRFELSGRLMDDVTKVINNYLHSATNNNDYTYNYFMTAVRKLKAFQTIADTLYYNQNDVRVNILFLEGHSNWLSSKSYELKECLKKADSAIALKPNAAYLYYLKGLLHIELKQYNEAFVYERKALALAPKWTYPYNDIGMIYARMGRPDSGLVWLFKALALDSNDHTHYSNIGWIFSLKGNTDSALLYYSKALQKDPKDFYVWNALGYTYYYDHKWDTAMRYFREAVHFNKSLYSAYEGMLLVHLESTKNNDSISYYARQMVSADSTNPIMYNELGGICQKYDLDTIALQMYERSIAIDSMNQATWVAAYSVCRKMKSYDLAERCLLFAVSIDTTAYNDDIYKTLGDFYYDRDSYEKAIRAYDKAVEINPGKTTNYLVYNSIGNSYFSLGKYDDALKYISKAIKLKPGDEVLYYNYGYISLANKDTVTTEIYYQKSIAANSKYASAYYGLAQLYANRGEHVKAIKMLEKAIEFGEYTRRDIEEQPAFRSLKENKEFLGLLLRAKQ